MTQEGSKGVIVVLAVSFLAALLGGLWGVVGALSVLTAASLSFGLGLSAAKSRATTDSYTVKYEKPVLNRFELGYTLPGEDAKVSGYKNGPSLPRMRVGYA